MYIKQKKLLSPEECKRVVPLSDKLVRVKAGFDRDLRANLGARRKFLTVCGPCSAGSYSAMDEYLTRLKTAVTARPELMTVARIYTAKPHSDGSGYKGIVFQQSADLPIDVNEGLLLCRKIMVRCIEIGLPVADELLYPEFYKYFDDLVSYWFVGARSSEDSLHRGIASSLEVCCGVKNPTDGSTDKAVDSLYAVSKPACFPSDGCEVTTSGCKYAHIVLRGGYVNGNYVQNLCRERVSQAKKLLQTKGLNDFVAVDLSHANSGKIAANQLSNAAECIADPNVNGVMIESFLRGGGMSDEYGVSQTDDCLGFEQTERLLDILQEGFCARASKS